LYLPKPVPAINAIIDVEITAVVVTIIISGGISIGCSIFL